MLSFGLHPLHYHSLSVPSPPRPLTVNYLAHGKGERDGKGHSRVQQIDAGQAGLCHGAQHPGGPSAKLSPHAQTHGQSQARRHAERPPQPRL